MSNFFNSLFRYAMTSQTSVSHHYTLVSVEIFQHYPTRTHSLVVHPHHSWAQVYHRTSTSSIQRYLGTCPGAVWQLNYCPNSYSVWRAQNKLALVWFVLRGIGISLLPTESRQINIRKHTSSLQQSDEKRGCHTLYHVTQRASSQQAA